MSKVGIDLGLLSRQLLVLGIQRRIENGCIYANKLIAVHILEDSWLLGIAGVVASPRRWNCPLHCSA